MTADYDHPKLAKVWGQARCSDALTILNSQWIKKYFILEKLFPDETETSFDFYNTDSR